MNLHFFRRIQFLRRRDQLDRELAEELEFHRAMKQRENERRGVLPGEAYEAAQRQMGSLTRAKESSRDYWSFPLLEQVAQDVSVAVRSLCRDRGFMTVVVLSLALGIGANTAIFAALRAVLLRPLPYPKPQQFFAVTQPMNFGSIYSGLPIVDPEYEAWRNENSVFDQLTCWSDAEFDLAGRGTPERLMAASVPQNFLTVLRISPVLGRNFTTQEDRPNGPRTVILTDRFWRLHLYKGESALGNNLQLDGRDYTVIGILPASFNFPGDINPEILVTAQLSPKPNWGAMTMRGVAVFGRICSGINPERAQADLQTISRREEPTTPAWLHHFRRNLQPLQVIPLQRELAGNSSWTLMLLFIAVVILLCIACANVASLQLSRAAARQGEVALRSALGAGRARLARFLLIESLVLSLIGGASGLLLACGLVSLLRATPLVRLKDVEPLTIDGAVLLFALLMSVGVGLLCGALPAFFASRPTIHDIIKSQTSAAFGLRSGLRSFFVLGEISLPLMLLVSSYLLIRSLQMCLALTRVFSQSICSLCRRTFGPWSKKLLPRKRCCWALN